MRIQRVRIQNYRCLRDVEVHFDDITTFIGPNGVGKSAVLRALNWFFNGDRQIILNEDDLSVEAKRPQISVEVEFGDLTALDRMALGKYAAGGSSTVRLWRRWEKGLDKLSGRALAYPPFNEIRQMEGARPRLARYRALRNERPELELPSVTSASQAEQAMNEWEERNPSELVPTDLQADTHFFGFAGQAKMTGLFDYIFVSADLRAGEESRDAKGTVIARILDQAVDRTEAEEELLDLQTLFNSQREDIHHKHFAEELDRLSEQLTTEIGQVTRGRSIRVNSLVPELRLPQAQFQISVQDGAAHTRVDQQGHGFQRALLITALRILAQSRTVDTNRTVFLAIEEPELFQHPVQARTFAAVLRKIASESGHGVQIAYATHSPYFLEEDGFAQVRRMTRTLEGALPSSRVHSATEKRVAARLRSLRSADQVRRQLHKVCLQEIPEALFANVVVLVEGSTEKGVIEGCALRSDPFGQHGVVVCDVGSKSKIPMAHAILSELGIPCYAVFDGDADRRVQLAQNKGMTEEEINRKVERSEQENHNLIGYLGGVPEGKPMTKVYDGYAVTENNLESYLRAEWPEWGAAQRRLIKEGRGVDGKNEDTYRRSAIEATTDPPAWLSDLMGKVFGLCPNG